MVAQAQPQITWQSRLGEYDVRDSGNAMCRTDDGGFFITGTALASTGLYISNHGEQDFLVARYNSNKELVWLNLYVCQC